MHHEQLERPFPIHFCWVIFIVFIYLRITCRAIRAMTSRKLRKSPHSEFWSVEINIGWHYKTCEKSPKKWHSKKKSISPTGHTSSPHSSLLQKQNHRVFFLKIYGTIDESISSIRCWAILDHEQPKTICCSVK